MKTILVSLNSKFIHSNLAIRYLSKYVEDIVSIPIYEFTINQQPEFIASEIYNLNPDVVGFSTYIWNLKETLRVCEILKLVRPELKILLGGPEVSYDGDEMMKSIPYIDYIIYGEGEETFKEFITSLSGKRINLEDIEGLIYRQGDRIIKTPERDMIRDLNTIPSPYEDLVGEFENRIVYYESSRGCPYNCQYCLSSTFKGVRYFDIERVKRDLTTLIEGRAKQVKFVDRTFNANKRHAMEIMKFIKDKDPEDINFHFEVTAHLMDDEFLNFLKDTKEGLFQLEIGVQSTNPDTIDTISRTTDFTKLSQVVKTIKSFKNIHQHLDLIAGLPYEGYDTFKQSFNDVYNLGAEKIQLGFLKLLKGSGLRLAEEEYGYKYIDEPPYEVLESKNISYEELLKLKAIEDLVEKYYNEGYFEHTLNYLIRTHYPSPFDFYEELSSYWKDKGYHRVLHKRSSLYKILMDFIEMKGFENELSIFDILKFDFILNNKNLRLKLPNQVDNSKWDIINLHDVLRKEEILSRLTEVHRRLPTKKLINKVRIERFDLDVIDLIENDYRGKGRPGETYILFEYMEGVITRANAFDISEIVREMI